MGYFKDIKLNNFRNFKQYSIEFSKNCNVLYGKNGSGKTNILEAISLFNKGRGIRKDQIINFIKYNEDNFVNFANFEELKGTYEIKINSEISNNNAVKKIYLNNDSSKEALDHLYSLFSFLVFLPETERLFIASPNFRRNFIDSFIFSRNNKYNTLINKYKRNIIERTKVLKLDGYEDSWIKKLEENISSIGIEIYKERNTQVVSIMKNISLLNQHEKLPFDLNIQLIDKFFKEDLDIEQYMDELKKSREIDQLIGGANKGPHKSDFKFLVNDNFLVSQLSTGQQKTIILLLFLAQSNYLVNECNLSPILLMDEVCSHLDDINRKLLLKISQQFNLQIFMTGTDKNLFSFLSTNTNFCNITV